MSTTTIQVHEETKQRLDTFKKVPRETYEEVLQRLIKTYEKYGEVR
jgi:predicted CopG family antitoxin